MLGTAANAASRRVMQQRLVPGGLTACLTSAAPATKGSMYGNQASLPQLPVPPLNQTLDKYLRSVKPLIKPEQFEHTLRVVEEFRKTGLPLHEKLLERARSTDHWLEEWWDNMGYLEVREPNVIYVNYFFHYKDDAAHPDQASRAASLVSAVLRFKQMCDDEAVPAETLGKTPLDMSQYKKMFNCTRIPHVTRDFLLQYATSKHIAVMYRNEVFFLDVVRNDGTALSPAELHALITSVLATKPDASFPHVGLLTSEDRTLWANAREQLLRAAPENAASLERLQSAIFTLCLDDSSPTTKPEVARGLWHGNGSNRWFDKSFQIIVFANGKAGLNGEHSGMDGTPTGNMSNTINHWIATDKLNHVPRAASPPTSLPPPQRMQLKSSPAVDLAILEARQHFDKLIGETEANVVTFPDFGKDYIKTCNISPDAWCQMAIQLAYMRLHNRTVPTYESGATRKFLRGRTETCRSVSLESQRWTNAMVDPSAPVALKRQLLNEAVKSQVAYMKDAVDGHGCDRHLMGLRLLQKPGETAPIFADPAYNYTRHWMLSTSQISSEHFDGYGWGPVVDDGYGIAYSVMNKWLHFNVTSWTRCPWTSADQMTASLYQALRDMRSLCDATNTQAKL